jgi:hypothetical protein
VLGQSLALLQNTLNKQLWPGARHVEPFISVPTPPQHVPPPQLCGPSQLKSPYTMHELTQLCVPTEQQVFADSSHVVPKHAIEPVPVTTAASPCREGELQPTASASARARERIACDRI